ncbi:MFS transporter [Brevibacterium daeguense]|uniref:MFS transporter n=1 Tax=Brevibacterium daeguense TaxID=909936 RepID=UPI001F01E52B
MSTGAGASAVREPGRVAYLALLGTTSVGTLSGNVINAPLHRIQQDFGATDSQTVLAVAAFTISMVVFVPLTGWLCDRFGPVRVVLAGLVVMVVAQALAAFSVNLEMLIALRAVQGIACSAYPPGVQRALAALWPSKGQAAMAAWASAIGVGQAIGPPVGGLVSELFGWRSVFVFQAVLCVLFAIAIVAFVPKVEGVNAPIHGLGMMMLMIAMGATVLTITLIGQRADPVTEIVVAIIASAGLAVYAFLATRYPEKLLEPRSLLEKRYIRGTVSAGTTMLVMGVCLVTLPLYLGEHLGLTPGPVGLVVFAMALSMALSGRLTSWLSEKLSTRLVIELGLGVLIIAPLALGWWTGFEAPAVAGLSSTAVQVAGVVLILLVIGVGINAGQSIAAFAISRSAAAQNSMAFGIHNTARFMGLATGYAWAALIYPLGNTVLLYGGAAAVALIALLTTVIGGPAGQVPARANR